MERLTRQNQTLEEQLRQKNAVIGNQEEDQEGVNADRRNQERPEGSNTPSKPEQQNISLLTLIDTAPPCRGDAGNEGADESYDDRPQGTSIQRS